MAAPSIPAASADERLDLARCVGPPSPLAASLSAAVEHAVGLRRRNRWLRLVTAPAGTLLALARHEQVRHLARRRRTRPTVLHPFFDLPMQGMLPETVAARIHVGGIHEPELTHAIVRLLAPGDVFIDVGAHIGYFTLLAARLVGPQGRVVAFEPTPGVHDLLAHNVESNGLSGRVTVERCGLWSSATTGSLKDFGPGATAFNSLLVPRAGRLRIAAVHEVPLLTLDAYLERQALRPTLVKFDAESSEFEILRGMTRTLSALRPLLTLEVGDVGAADLPTSRDLIDAVTAHGYAPFELAGLAARPHRPRAHYRYDNILLVPTEKVGDYLQPLGRSAGTARQGS